LTRTNLRIMQVYMIVVNYRTMGSKWMINRDDKMGSLFETDGSYGYETTLCGIDEAGRGSIAGPLVVAGVVLLDEIEGIDDSKKLSKRRREILYRRIMESSIVHIVLTEAWDIDRYGLSKSISSSLLEIRAYFDGVADGFLFDGNSSFGVDGIETLIKADGKVAEVGAASIVAKVFRDRIVSGYDAIYGDYDFSSHKGYGTTSHIEAIERLGYTPLHRRSFHLKRLEDIDDKDASLFG